MQNRPKKPSKIDATSITIFDPSWEALGGRFGRVLGAMLASKMHYKLNSNFERFFARFFIDFWLMLTPSKP